MKIFSGYVREQKRYTKNELKSIFSFDEAGVEKFIKSLKAYGVLKSVKNSTAQLEMSDLLDEDIEITDETAVSGDCLYVFTYVGVITSGSREIEVGTDGRHMKTPDFMLVDSAGFVDILEIKKPDGIKVVSTTEYRNNYVASRDLEGAIVQIEKYIYILNHEGEARVKKIQDKVRNHLPSNFRLKVVNPQGILLLGRSNNLTDEQLFDFEIIKRQHKNIVDIMTYDDLLKRFRNILNQIKNIR